MMRRRFALDIATAARRLAVAVALSLLPLVFVAVTAQAAEPPATPAQDAAQPDPASPIKSIDDLWAGFDPRALPLEIDVIDSRDEGDTHLETIYFTGEVFEGEKTRIFAYLGRPRQPAGKIPGILHIHGGGQTANIDWVRFWVHRGYRR